MREPTRRRVLQVATGVLGCAVGGRVALAAPGSGAAPATPAPPAAAAKAEDLLDEALQRIHAQEPVIPHGLSTHAPMVVETLCVLGRADHAGTWLDGYRGPALELPAARARIDAKHWRAALGPAVPASPGGRTHSRWRDWLELFTAELRGAPWREVLETWAPRLAPGMSGAATHGVIRTSHAVRAIARRDTPPRRAELARGLAYWASSYEEVTGSGPWVDLERVPRYADVMGRPPGGRSIVEGLRHVRELATFPALPDPAPDPAADLSALTARFARAYLRHGTRHDAIAFVHAVTGPCSLRRMAPHLRPDTVRAAMPHAWHAATAIYAAYARGADPARAAEPRLSRGELIARAIDSGDEHAIKFTETLLAEHDLQADPAYLAAAEDAVGRL